MAGTKKVVFGLEAQDNATPKLKQAANAADALAAKLKALDGAGSMQGLRRNLVASVNDLRSASAAVTSISTAAIARANNIAVAQPQADNSYGLRSAAAAGWATKNPWVGQSTGEIWGRFAKEQVAEAKAAVASFGRSLADNKLAIAGWATAVGLAGKAALDAAIRVDRLDKAYTTITGDSVLAERQLEFVRQKSNELGHEFFGLAEASRNFFAAMKGTSIEKDANDIFESVAMAATALSLSDTDIEGTFRALGQMVSKGKVQAEELRGQLGERLPGAFQYAAKAMGMTTMELDKALELGNVLADEMLPKLAVVLREEFGSAAVQAASGLQQELNRVNTEWERFKSSVLDSEMVAAALKGISGTLRQFNDLTDAADKRKKLIAEMESQGVQKLGYKEWFDADMLGNVSKKYSIFYTDEQIAGFKALKDAAADAKQSIVSTQTATEKTLSNASRTVKNYLKDTEESRRTSLRHEYDNVVATIDKAIEARKQEGQSYADLVADRARVDAEYARKREGLDKKFKPKDSAKAKEKAYKQETRDLDMVADVMQELEQKTGQYGLAVSAVNELIDRQGELWLKAGVPQGYVDQLKEIRRLEASTDGLDKMKLGWMEFYTESMDWGTQAGCVLSGTVDSFSASLAEMAMTGKASFSDLARSMASDLTKIATKMMMVWAIEKALGWAVSAISIPNATDTAAIANGFSSANPAVDMYAGMFHKGGVVGSSSGPSRLVPSSLFAGAPRFHGGTGYVKPGEYPAILKAGERVLNPAETRAYQSGTRVNLIINNNASGVDVQTSQRENADGSLDIEATIVRVVDRDMNRRGGLLNKSLRNNWGQRSIVTKR